MTTNDTARAKEQARAQLDSIVAMVRRLRHAQECDGEDCNLTDEEIYNGLNLYYQEGNVATDEDREEYHDEERARVSIDEDPLSLEVRSEWHTPGEGEDTEYMILLCTGGPACRITGDLNRYHEPESAQIEYQDWFTPWEKLLDTTPEEDEALLYYAQHFYFGA